MAKNFNADITLGNCFFGFVKLTKNAGYTGYLLVMMFDSIFVQNF